MWRLGPAPLDLPSLTAAWHAAAPFPHLVFDDVLDPARHDEVMAIVDDEPTLRYGGELFVFDATAPTPTTAAFARLRDDFAAALAPPLTAITGKPVTRVDMRGFAYGPGDYLLPHTDHQLELGRALAYACYLPTPAPPRGGELELFRCERADDELTATEPARTIAARSNRLVVFDVSPVSLHQVREVLGGRRISLAGWFYP